jgi:hypothetical protein
VSVTDEAFVERLEAASHVGDPPADALVAAFRRLPGGAGWRMLDEALDGRAPQDAPPELAALVDPQREPPAWLDLDAVDAGAVAFWRVGSPVTFLALAYGSLAFGYQSAPLVRPLAATGRLERMAPRRLAETIHWALDVTPPGGMHVGAAGWRSSIRVRMVHALVRDHLLRSGRWDEEWGVPISAAGAFATAIGGFFVIPVRAMEDLGVRFSAREHEALCQLWRWVGHIMGMPEELQPRDAAQARAWIDAAVARDEGPIEDSPRLMRALLDHGLALDERFPGVVARPARAVSSRLVGALTRRWLGREMADALDVPGRPFVPLVPLLRPAAWARDAVRATGVLSDARIAALEIALARQSLGTRDAPAGPLAPEEAAGAPVLGGRAAA